MQLLVKQTLRVPRICSVQRLADLPVPAIPAKTHVVVDSEGSLPPRCLRATWPPPACTVGRYRPARVPIQRRTYLFVSGPGTSAIIVNDPCFACLLPPLSRDKTASTSSVNTPFLRRSSTAFLCPSNTPASRRHPALLDCLPLNISGRRLVTRHCLRFRHYLHPSSLPPRHSALLHWSRPHFFGSFI